MIQPALSDEATLSLHRLHIGEAGGPGAETEVGRPETGVFVGLPSEGVELIRLLSDGLTVGEVKRRFAERHGQEPELGPFVDAIVSCGFVRAIDGEPVATEHAEDSEQPRGLRLLDGLDSERVAWLLSPPMIAVYAAIWIAVPALLVIRPDLAPSAARAWVHPRVMVDLVVLAVLGWILVFWHELAHMVALRARGCPGSFTLSYRLYFLVVQTNMWSIRAIPRRRRYAPYLAGMTWDLAVLLTCLLLELAGVASPLPGAIAYLLTFSLLFQFQFFMRTDVYFVITNWLRLGNLMGDTRLWLRSLPGRVLGRPWPAELAALPERELRIVRAYALFAVVGVAITVGQFLVLGLPLLLHFLGQAVAGLGGGPRQLSFWDSAAFLLVTLGEFGVLGAVVCRQRWPALLRPLDRLRRRSIVQG